MHDVLIVSAHPDDFEIGAGGTIQKLRMLGCDVTACILTADLNAASARLRNVEAKEAAAILGIGRIFFLDFPDGSLAALAPNIERFRLVLKRERIKPELVLTHTLNDSHNDHRAAAELVLGAFRQTTILHFAVVNSLIRSAFRPRVFVDITAFRAKKYEALHRHASQAQLGRIHSDDMRNLEQDAGEPFGIPFAEVFELTVQEGASKDHTLINALSDSPFNSFWNSVIADRGLVYVYGTTRVRNTFTNDHELAESRSRDALALLRAAFRRHWIGDAPLEELSANDQDAELLIGQRDILLEGGPVANRMALSYFNHIPQLRYIVDYSIPGFTDIRIHDRLSGSDLRALYKPSPAGLPRPITDRGVLTIMQNPLVREKTMIGCMGIHAQGTYGCLKALCDNDFLREFCQRVSLPIESGVFGYQLLISIDCLSEVIVPEWDTLVSFAA